MVIVDHLSAKSLLATTVEGIPPTVYQHAICRRIGRRSAQSP